MQNSTRRKCFHYFLHKLASRLAWNFYWNKTQSFDFRKIYGNSEYLHDLNYGVTLNTLEPNKRIRNWNYEEPQNGYFLQQGRVSLTFLIEMTEKEQGFANFFMYNDLS